MSKHTSQCICPSVIDSNETETWAPGSTSDFAGWEAHTRGIGSKLMSKMGYEFGKGKRFQNATINYFCSQS